MRAQVRGMTMALMLPLGIWGVIRSQEPPTKPPADGPVGQVEAKVGSGATATATATTPAASWTTAVEPKPIAPAVKKGLDWLVEHQLKDGGWGQGDESQQMGGGGNLRDKANVADTSIAALALIRSGSTPQAGPYKDAVARAVRYVREQVEASDAQSLAVSAVQGTRVQAKLGPNIDTFLASLLLAEANGRMGDGGGNKSVDLALTKVLGKIKAHQKADGTWDNKTGWAPILAQSIAGKGMNRAAQAQYGMAVSDNALARFETASTVQFVTTLGIAAATPAAKPAGARSTAGPVAVALATDGSKPVGTSTYRDLSGADIAAKSGRMAGGVGSAGVELYDRASSLSGLQDSVNTNATRATTLRKVVAEGKDKAEVAKAQATLKRFDSVAVACSDAQQAVLARLDDKGFVAGFGSNGGEEFLSYMNIGESLVLKGGPEWKKWDEAMTGNLGRVQNDDGSWTGHHCITGRNFCTSTALLVLLGDRTPVPAEAKAKAVPTAAAR